LIRNEFHHVAIERLFATQIVVSGVRQRCQRIQFLYNRLTPAFLVMRFKSFKSVSRLTFFSVFLSVSEILYDWDQFVQP
jgi:hypothetical protein